MPKYMGQGLAEKLGELAGLAPEDQEVVAYGLEYLLSSTIGVVQTLLAGLLLGLFRETLAVLLCWGMLRPFAGGTHCTALWRCTVLSCMGILTVALAAKGAVSLVPATAWVAFCTAWALLAVWLWAPNNSARKIRDSQRRRRLRRRALALVLFFGIFLFYLALRGTTHIQALAVAGVMGLAAGAFMLSPAGFRLMAWSDKKLELMQQKFAQRR
ncbi:MAG: accessory gene regulator B family protein [Bacillota bacterium]